MYSFLKILPLGAILFIGSCSATRPENQWQHDAAELSQSYQRHFLQDKGLRASQDLRYARKAASHSAKLYTLIDVELTACAMELIAFNPTPCHEASRLLEIEPDKHRYAYLNLLTSKLSQEEIPLLPDQYRDFAYAYLEDDALQINEALSVMTPLSSRLVSSFLSRESIDERNLLKLIDELSFHGYKNPLLHWLSFKMRNEGNPLEKQRLKQKIEILNSH